MSLPSEIILLIIEAMDYEPRMFEKLMSISMVGTPDCVTTIIRPLASWSLQLSSINELRSLVQANVGSLSTSFGKKFLREHQIPARFLSLSSKKNLLQPYSKLTSSAYICSRLPNQVFPRNFSWLEELHRRSIITDELISKLSKDIIKTVNKFCPSLRNDTRCSDKGLRSRVEAYHRWAIQTLFRVFDAANYQSTDRRQVQENVIKSMSASELASLILMVHAMCIYYVETLPTPASNVIGGVRETNCIYRELELRHGPGFIWASLYGSDGDKTRITDHVERGLDELMVYESSNGELVGTLIYGRSLQSVLMKEYCKKKGCDGLSEAWDAVCDDVVDLVLLPECPVYEHIYLES